MPTEAGLLSGLEEPILQVDAELVIRELLSQPRGLLQPATAPITGIVGEPLDATLARLLAPAALRETLDAIATGYSKATIGDASDIAVLRAVEGITPPGNRSPGWPRYYDVALHFTPGPAVLLRMNDVTERLRLAQALEQAHAAHELALAVLRAPPRKLRLFLQGAATSMSLINSTLRMPARSQQAFADKLDRILAEVQMLRGAAGDLALAALEERASSFEQALASLRAGPLLTGDDLLPLAVRLDDLFLQIAAASSLDEQRGVSQADASPALKPAAAAEPDWSLACDQRLRQLVKRVADEQGRSVQLVMLGASHVPDCYAKSVDSMLSHLVRNAVEHGIENPELRAATGKRATGTITVECADLAEGGIELTVQDDGAGFDVERIGRIAVETGLLTDESLARTDPRALIGLIFRPGFSTAGVAGCNGRGLGMEFLRELVTRLNGTITVATKSRQYTRFRIVLPAADSQRALTGQQRVA